MASSDVAAYLQELGSNQRKLQYCRQIMAANTNFIPNCIFNIKSPENTNTQTKSQFIQNVKNLGLGCNPQEEELIFSYFQIDNKNYITFDEFQQLIVPQADQSYKKLIIKRKGEEFTLDYALRFALQKYFFQIIENQVKLELMCKFTFVKDKKEQKKVRAKRLDTDGLIYFMNAHGKFPEKKMCEFIVRQINFNKGQNRRNVLIVEYMLQFNDKYKHKQPLPTVARKDVTYVPPPSSKKQELNKPSQNKENTNINYQQSRYQVEESKYVPINSMGSNGYQDLANSFVIPGSQSRAGKTFSAINQVQNRIKMLMNEVSIKNTNLSVSEYQTKQQKPKGYTQKREQIPKKVQIQRKEQLQKKEQMMRVPELKNSIVQQIRSELRKQKQGKSQSKSDSNFKNLTIKSKRQINDRQYSSSRNDFEVQAVTTRNKTDRIMDSNIKKKEGFQHDNQSYGSSRIVHKPKTSSINPPAASNPAQKNMQFVLEKNYKYEYLSGKNITNKSADEGKRRIQYLKRLIQQKDRYLGK